MTEELDQLRAEVASLKRDMKHVFRLLNQEEDEGEPRPKFPTFEGEKLVARSDQMHIPFMVNATENGAELLFMDKEHRTRALLSIGGDSACLEFRNVKGNLIAQLTEAPDGSGQFCVCDAEGNPRAGMRVNEFGGVVNVVDEKARAQAAMMGKEDGGEMFVVNDHHHMSVNVKATERGGMVTVHEPSGQVMGFLMADGNTGTLAIHGPLGNPALGLIANDDGGGIVFKDAEGNSKGVLP